MVKRMTALDSAHQIGLSTSLEDVLIVVLGPSTLDYKQERNWSRFHLYLHNQGRYGKTDDGVGFSTSNRYIHVLGRRSNCSWKSFMEGVKKQRNNGRLSLYLHNQRRYGKADGGVGFSALNRSIHVLGRRSNRSCGSSSLDFKKQRNWSCFNLYLHNQGRYGKADSRTRFSASNRYIHGLGRRSNCSWGSVITGLKKQRNWSRFNLYLHNPGCYGKTDGSIGFSASISAIHVL